MTEEAKSALDKEQPLDSMKEALVNTEEAKEAPSSPRPGSTPSKSNPLLAQFRVFAKFGDTKADGKAISLSQSDKW